MRILVTGASGMIGSMLLHYLFKTGKYELFGQVKTDSSKLNLKEHLPQCEIISMNLNYLRNYEEYLKNITPDVIINCAGIVKQHPLANEVEVVLPLNSILPHDLKNYCNKYNKRLIQISTDCVFSGKTGNYKEDDYKDANDLYGISKSLGEVDGSNSITVRTSAIGPEILMANGLLSWVLSQKGVVSGYKNAIFSGLSTFEIARVIETIILPNSELSGVYNLASKPIDKFSLLKIISDIYKLKIDIVENNSIKINRSLNYEKIAVETGYKPKSWEQMVFEMNETHLDYYK